jgi:hypothetical protein
MKHKSGPFLGTKSANFPQIKPFVRTGLKTIRVHKIENL